MSVVCPSSTLFKHFLPRNHWADWNQISHGVSLGKFVQTVLVTWPRWPPSPNMAKTLKNLLLRNQKADDLETWYAQSGARVLPSLFKLWPWVDLDLFTARSDLVPYAFVWEKGKTMDFSETIGVYDLKIATDDRSDKKFLLTSKLCLVRPAPGLYTCIKSWKELYQIRLQRNFFETCNKWVKWQGLSVDIKILSPGGCLPLPRGYIHVLNHEKNCIK